MLHIAARTTTSPSRKITFNSIATKNAGIHEEEEEENTEQNIAFETIEMETTAKTTFRIYRCKRRALNSSLKRRSELKWNLLKECLRDNWKYTHTHTFNAFLQSWRLAEWSMDVCIQIGTTELVEWDEMGCSILIMFAANTYVTDVYARRAHNSLFRFSFGPCLFHLWLFWCVGNRLCAILYLCTNS